MAPALPLVRRLLRSTAALTALVATLAATSAVHATGLPPSGGPAAPLPPSGSPSAPLAARWLQEDGRLGPAAHAALQLLQQADQDGLRPADYGADTLARRGRDLAEGAPGTSGTSAQGIARAFERDLDDALQRYLRDLRLGRADPRSLGFRVPRVTVTVPPVEQVAQAAREGRLESLVQAQRPRISQYARLRDALARYRQLAALPWEPLPPLAGASRPRSVRPGEPYAAVDLLRQRLMTLGDLPEGPLPGGDGTYDNALSEAVMRFQERHGLGADGVLGAGTWRALNVPPAQRVRQLELALERLRWLPDLGSSRWIGINIPMYRMWAADLSGAQPLLQGKVVVGKALDTQTPVLQEQMRHVIFRPYWNVPRSIVRGEILPAVARQPGYLERHDMELVRGGGDDGAVVPATAANLALLRDGQLRLRQRPGPRNSLGLVKFMFPNDHNVYLHGTPAQSLFGRPRRDFSHGCVRVEDPVALAEWVLKEQPAWTRERIVEAMDAERSQQVNLRQPIPVLLFYLTAMVMPGTQTLHFAEDVYRHDARLQAALDGRR